MKQSLLNRCVALVAVAVTVVGCTMKEQEPPPLTGPSEFAQSLTVTVTPDVIFQDGASQSIVTANAKGPNGNPLANISLRAEISVGGVVTDFGKLSARNIVTDGNGRATVVYTAPATPTGPVVDEFRLVNIAITPHGNDFGNSVPRVTTLRLVPPSGGSSSRRQMASSPSFTFTPTSPTDHENVLFDASGSEAPANNPIAAVSLGLRRRRLGKRQDDDARIQLGWNVLGDPDSRRWVRPLAVISPDDHRWRWSDADSAVQFLADRAVGQPRRLLQRGRIDGVSWPADCELLLEVR